MKTARRRAARGLTLIEMMVAIVVGMLMTAVAFSVMRTSETRKRTTTTVNDINQAGNYAAYLIDQWVRSAGSGMGQTARFAYGCAVYAAKGATQVLPRTGALPAPFADVHTAVSGTFRLAPVVIFPDGTTPGVSGSASDALVVMASGTGTAGAPYPFNGFATSTQLTLNSSVGITGGDLLLVADQQAATGGGPANCMVQQAASTFTGGTATALSLGGSFANATVGSVSVADFSGDGVVVNLGGGSSRPNFLVMGVGDNNALFTYDLLQQGDTPLQARAEGVFEMKALYGFDANEDGRISDSEWVSPSASGYTPADLLDGSAAASRRLQLIKAVRVGMLMRTSLPERTTAGPDAVVRPSATAVSLFDDLDGAGLKYERTLTTAEQAYRYRKVEFTVPLRNNLLF